MKKMDQIFMGLPSQRIDNKCANSIPIPYTSCGNHNETWCTNKKKEVAGLHSEDSLRTVIID